LIAEFGYGRAVADKGENGVEGAGRRRMFLMRHGAVDYFDPALADPGQARLTNEGRAQVAAAAEALGATRFDIAVHSDLPRARETADIILAGNAAAPKPEPVSGLQELKVGWLRAGSREELAARLAYGFDAAGEPGAALLPGGETFAEAETRIVAVLTGLLTRRTWRTALIVAHEGVNRIALGWASRGGLKSIAAFEQDLACINVIDADITPAREAGALQIERLIIKALNVTPYDYVKHGLSRTSLEHLLDVDLAGARPAAGDKSEEN